VGSPGQRKSMTGAAGERRLDSGGVASATRLRSKWRASGRELGGAVVTTESPVVWLLVKVASPLIIVSVRHDI
jgi:hypothetical protein